MKIRFEATVRESRLLRLEYVVIVPSNRYEQTADPNQFGMLYNALKRVAAGTRPWWLP